MIEFEKEFLDNESQKLFEEEERFMEERLKELPPEIDEE